MVPSVVAIHCQVGEPLQLTEIHIQIESSSRLVIARILQFLESTDGHPEKMLGTVCEFRDTAQLESPRVRQRNKDGFQKLDRSLSTLSDRVEGDVLHGRVESNKSSPIGILFLYHQVRAPSRERGPAVNREESEPWKGDTAIVRVQVLIEFVEMERVHPLGVRSKAVDLDSLLVRVHHDVVPDPGSKELVKESADEDNVKEGTFVEIVAEVVKDLSCKFNDGCHWQKLEGRSNVKEKCEFGRRNVNLGEEK